MWEVNYSLGSMVTFHYNEIIYNLVLEFLRFMHISNWRNDSLYFFCTFDVYDELMQVALQSTQSITNITVLKNQESKFRTSISAETHFAKRREVWCKCKRAIDLFGSLGTKKLMDKFSYFEQKFKEFGRFRNESDAKQKMLTTINIPIDSISLFHTNTLKLKSVFQ